MVPPPPPSAALPNPARNSFLRGFGMVLLFHLIQLPLIPLTIGLALAVFGAVQLAYVIPLAVRAYNRHETARLQGILIAAGLTILLNGICDVSFFSNFNPH